MKTWKITKLVSVNEFNWDHWTTYYIKMELDNWDTISLWKKNKDAFKVWDEVKYEEYQNSKWFTAWKEVRENNWYRKSDNRQSQEWYFTSIAFQIWFQGFNPLDDNENFQARVLASRRIFSEMMDNYSNPDTKENGNTDQNTESPKQTKTEEKQEDELPF